MTTIGFLHEHFWALWWLVLILAAFAVTAKTNGRVK
jgi:hypothetical protein